MEQKTCFVSMPFGMKLDPGTGRVVDFDRVYQDVVLPAAIAVGYTTMRADKIGGVTLTLPLILQLLSSDLFVADLTATNPNVMYELGLRHALSNSTTLLIMEAGSRLPFDLGYYKVIVYRITESGALEYSEAVRAKAALVQAIKEGNLTEGSLSPVYQLLPNLRPPELIVPETASLPGSSRKSRGPVISPFEAPIESLRQAEETIKSGKDAEPSSVIEVMKGYRVKSAWEDMVSFAAALPNDIKLIPQVAQMTALALNRLGRHLEGIEILRSVILRTGPDSETLAIIGLSYKRLYASEQRKEYLDSAIDCYRQSFELAPNDYYAGLNLASLLALYTGDDGRKELEELVPRLRSQLAQRAEDPRADFWDLASAIELAVIARDWPAANKLLPRLLSSPGSEWGLASALQQLQLYRDSMGPSDGRRLQALLEPMQQRSGVMQRNA